MTDLPQQSLYRRIIYGPNGVRAGWRLLIFVLILAAIIAVEGFVLSRLHKYLPHGFNAYAMLVQEATIFGTVLLASWLMSLIERRPMGEYGLPLHTNIARKFGVGALWGFGQLTVVMLLLAAIGVYHFGSIALSGAEIIKFAVLWGLVFLTVGFFEEYLFRGYFLYTLTSGIGFWPTAVILSVIFAAAHVSNGGESKAGIAAVALVGIFLCLMLRRTGDLWWAVGWHMAFDWGESYFYSVADSGMQAQGHLFNSSMQGNVWLTGGTVGPEASLVTIASVIVAIALFAWVYPDAKYPRAPVREAVPITPVDSGETAEA